MSAHKTGRKHRALERIKRNQNFIDQEFQKRRDVETAISSRDWKKSKIADEVASVLTDNPNISTRRLQRKFKIHRNTAAELREQLGFVVPKKDYLCHKQRYSGQWPKQPGEREGICACGCGGQTTMAMHASKQTGMKPGDYYRFISGHQWNLRRRLFKPKGWKSSHDINRERDTLRVEIANVAAKLPRYLEGSVATFEDLRGRMKRIELQSRTIPDQQVSRMLNVAKWMPDVMGLKIPTLIKATVVTREEWRVRLCSISTTLGQQPTFDDIRRVVGDPIPFPNQTISRFLNRARDKNPSIPLIITDYEKQLEHSKAAREAERQALSEYRRMDALRRQPLPPMSEFFPYNRSDDLLEEVLSVIPEKFQGKRADLAHDIIEEIVSGRCKREELPEKAPGLIARFYRRHSFMGHAIVSLDAPLNEDGMTLLDVLDIKESMTELNGGINYDTQQEYFETESEFDGKIVARY